jgi:hypothetical protein
MSARPPACFSEVSRLRTGRVCEHLLLSIQCAKRALQLTLPCRSCAREFQHQVEPFGPRKAESEVG